MYQCSRLCPVLSLCYFPFFFRISRGEHYGRVDGTYVPFPVFPFLFGLEGI